MSCNMSIGRGDEVYFDESFQGWGSEDVEFAYRMSRREHRQIILDAECIVHSLEDSAIQEYDTIRPRTHHEIAACLHDLFTFFETYQAEELRSTLAICKHFEMGSSGEWLRTTAEERQGRSADLAIAEAYDWWLQSRL